MTTFLMILAVIAGVAIIATVLDALFHDGSHSHGPPTASRYPDTFDHRWVA